MSAQRPMRSRVARLVAPVTDDDFARGPADAPVTLVVYGDFECPFCGALHSTVAQLRDQFGDALRVVFRHFPMGTMHPHARSAAKAAEAAALQDRAAFWELHDLMYANQGALTDSDLVGYAERIGLDVERFRADFGSEEVDQRIQEDFISGARSGVNGTPTIFVEGERYDGPHTVQMLGAAIAQRLRSR